MLILYVLAQRSGGSVCAATIHSGGGGTKGYNGGATSHPLFVDALLCFFINSTVKLAKTHKTGNTTTTHKTNFSKNQAHLAHLH